MLQKINNNSLWSPSGLLFITAKFYAILGQFECETLKIILFLKENFDEKKVVIKSSNITSKYKQAIPTPEECDYLFQSVADLKSKWNNIVQERGADWRNLTFGFVDSCTNLDYCFNVGYTNLEDITALPKYVVGRNVTSAKSFAYSSWGIEYVPGTVMDGLPKLQYAYGAFMLVSQKPSVIIGEELFSKNTQLVDLTECFGEVSKMVKAPELWKKFQHVSHRSCFRNCQGASNWNEIPSDWK